MLSIDGSKSISIPLGNIMVKLKFVDTVNITKIDDINDYLNFPDWAYIVIIVYHIPMLICAMGGNIIVLYGTLKCNAISMDKVSLIFLEHLAFVDFFIAFLSGTTILITTFTKKWVLGEAMCFIQGMIGYIPTFCELLTLVIISGYRVFVLMRPFVAQNMGKKHGKIIMGIIWGFSIIFVVNAVFIMGQYTFFDPYILGCNTSGLSAEPGQLPYTIICVVLFGGLPVLLIVVSNVIILYIASKYVSKKAGKKGSISKNAVITVSAVSWVFVISVTPLCLRAMLQVLQVQMPTWFYIMQTETYYLNVACNPIIYTLTNARFKRFIMRIVYSLLGMEQPAQMNDIVTQVQQMNRSRMQTLKRANAVNPMNIHQIAVKAIALNSCQEVIDTSVSYTSHK